MDLGLKGKRVLVTAGSRGLGRASALALAAEGADIAVAGRDLSKMSELLDALREAGAGKAVAVRIDLSERDTLAAGVAEAVEHLGGIDIFVANTGGPASGPFLDIERKDWELALNESLLPVVDLCHLVLPHMRQQKWGRILFVTTVGVKIVQPNMVLSDSIRLAMVGMAKSLSIEFAHEGIMVNCLCPGPFATDRMEYLVTSSMERDNLSRADAEALWLNEVPAQKFGDPSDFGAMVAMLSSERGGFITGTAIALDGGKSRAY
ncbi:SDR family oxidoreductase [Pseudohoeflea coraliihabitans]|uniref:SDR family oxidoreductase n=1 Tax=Pseudohoeflea coraliihabitans TaxID=2860393 RepID=A0ABS6WJN0_9HYPH|nr:SDR family oxidoreductase [Pseudohoeflea sp. DP4N28-3]MBW3095853.1 SDR family oxidoreductase [Pseudohoeflea sp. DP4N28-3]